MPRGPLHRTEFVVMEFNHSTARLAVHGTHTYSASNREDALADARKASAAARSRKLPLTYSVVKVAEEAVFPASGIEF